MCENPDRPAVEGLVSGQLASYSNEQAGTIRCLLNENMDLRKIIRAANEED